MESAVRRVYCLYRVSTKAQTLSMQQQACRAYAQNKNWTIVKEIQSKGMSGLMRMDKRSDLKAILKAAQAKEFDILLVFMFDRLGRRNQDTTLFTIVLHELEIKIWSVQEGELELEQHVDKLKNYLHHWHAEQESINISMRVKTKMDQLAQDGIYRGGNIPYGYQLVWHGRLNRAGGPAHDLEVNPEEASVVRSIYELYKAGNGVHKIANHLNRTNIENPTGKPWRANRIHYILTNRSYMGIIRNGDVESNIMPHLQIVTPEQFLNVQNEIASKKRSLTEPTYKAFFQDKVYCGQCGEPMKIRHISTRYKSKSGDEKVYKGLSYTCVSGGACKPKSVSAIAVDQQVLDAAKHKIHKIKSTAINGVKDLKLHKELSELKERIASIHRAIAEKQTVYDELSRDMIEAVTIQDSDRFNAMGSQLSLLSQQLAEDTQRLVALEQERDLALSQRVLLRKRVTELAGKISQYNALSEHRKIEILKMLIGAVTVHGKSDIKVEWSDELECIIQSAANTKKEGLH